MYYVFGSFFKPGITVLFIFLFICLPTPVFADDTGLKAPIDYDHSNVTMHHAESAFSLDDITATADRTGESVVYKDFNLSTSPDATINGIEISVRAHSDSPSMGRTFQISLSWDNGISYTSPVDTGNFGNINSIRILGGQADTWGRAWTVNDLTNEHFRVRLQASPGIDSIYLDCLQVRIYYFNPSKVSPPPLLPNPPVSPNPPTIIYNVIPTTPPESSDIPFVSTTPVQPTPHGGGLLSSQVPYTWLPDPSVYENPGESSSDTKRDHFGGFLIMICVIVVLILLVVLIYKRRRRN